MKTYDSTWFQGALSALDGYFFVDKGSIFRILAKTLFYIVPITNLAKYEPNRRTLKNQLDIPTRYKGNVIQNFDISL